MVYTARSGTLTLILSILIGVHEFSLNHVSQTNNRLYQWLVYLRCHLCRVLQLLFWHIVVSAAAFIFLLGYLYLICSTSFELPWKFLSISSQHELCVSLCVRTIVALLRQYCKRSDDQSKRERRAVAYQLFAKNWSTNWKSWGCLRKSALKFKGIW